MNPTDDTSSGASLPPGSAGGRALLLATVASVVLALGKFALALVTGSLAVMAGAADSVADAFMSGANWLGYRHARTPADESHPYGHGKFEGALALGQAMLLLGIVGSLGASCVNGLWAGRPLPRVPLAIATLLVSGVVAAGITVVLARAKRQESSLILLADSAHYRIDVLAAGGASLGLLVAHLKGWPWLDPAIGLGAVALMAREAIGLLRRAAAELLDESLPADEVTAVRQVLETFATRVVAFHGLRTRRSGPLRFVEVHAVLDAQTSLGEAHRLVQQVGQEIREVLPRGSRVLVLPDAEGFEDAVDQHLDRLGGQPSV